MKILSLFDGMSCGQIAFNKLEIHIDKYYSSEVDKYAITVAQANYPKTIQVGNINNWQNWNIEKPDIIIGGSPCQGFSFAGKQLNFNDDRSKLFFVFVDILKHYKPKYFLLENVVMKDEFQKVISDLLGVEPIKINSALVSAQNRNRLYWTNIPGIEQPQDKQIYLKDVIENPILKGAYCDNIETAKDFFNRNKNLITLTEKAGKESQSFNRFMKNTRALNEKAKCMTASMFKGMANNGTTNVIINNTWRKLTPIECERLQTVPDNYTNYVSNTQRYKMLGNGFTVDVIAHILESIKGKKMFNTGLSIEMTYKGATFEIVYELDAITHGDKVTGYVPVITEIHFQGVDISGLDAFYELCFDITTAFDKNPYAYSEWF